MTDMHPHMLQQLDQLEAELLDGMHIPLSGRCLVRQHKATEIIAAIRMTLQAVPVEFSRELNGGASGLDGERLEANDDLSKASQNSGFAAPGNHRHTRHGDLSGRIRPPSLPRRKSIRVLLSRDELDRLDELSTETGLDRASIMRHLFLTYANNDVNPNQSLNNQGAPRPVSRINIADMGAKPTRPSIALIEPQSFDEAVLAAKAVREGTAVVLNLTMMEPDQAQRAVDFVSGATFNVDGCQERIGESIFIFSPCEFELQTSHGSGDSSSQGLIEGMTASDAISASERDLDQGSKRKGLTDLQSRALHIISERWKTSQRHTSASDLSDELNHSDEHEDSLRLARKLLFFLEKNKYIENVSGEAEPMTYRPSGGAEVNAGPKEVHAPE